MFLLAGDNLKTFFVLVFNFMQRSFSFDGFRFSLWSVLVFAGLASIVGKFFGNLYSYGWDAVGSLFDTGKRSSKIAKGKSKGD